MRFHNIKDYSFKAERLKKQDYSCSINKKIPGFEGVFLARAAGRGPDLPVKPTFQPNITNRVKCGNKTNGEKKREYYQNFEIANE